MSATEIELKVREIIDGHISNHETVAFCELTDPLFESKLGLDSLDLVELCMSLEETFEFLKAGIESDDSEKWRTVGDVVRFVQEKSISENPCPSVAKKFPMKIRCVNCGFDKTACFMCWDCWRPTLVAAVVSPAISFLVLHYLGALLK